jgi:hypothetical protein
MKKRMIVLLLACVTVAGVTSVAWAAVGDGGTIKTCYKTATATWRPIDSSASCKSGETQLDFYSKIGADATFLGKTAKAADSDKLDGIDSTGFLGATAKAADSDKLDGLDSTDFLGATAKAADSDKLDGIDSTGFVQGAGSLTAYQFGNGDGAFIGGNLFTNCQGNGTYTLNFQSTAGDYTVWVADGATTTKTAVGPNGSTTNLIVFNPGSGTRHVVVLASGSGVSKQWDMMYSGNGTNECAIGVQQQIVGLSTLP